MYANEFRELKTGNLCGNSHIKSLGFSIFIKVLQDCHQLAPESVKVLRNLMCHYIKISNYNATYNFRIELFEIKKIE